MMVANEKIGGKIFTAINLSLKFVEKQTRGTSRNSQIGTAVPTINKKASPAKTRPQILGDVRLGI